MRYVTKKNQLAELAKKFSLTQALLRALQDGSVFPTSENELAALKTLRIMKGRRRGHH